MIKQFLIIQLFVSLICSITIAQETQLAIEPGYGRVNGFLLINRQHSYQTYETPYGQCGLIFHYIFRDNHINICTGVEYKQVLYSTYEYSNFVDLKLVKIPVGFEAVIGKKINLYFVGGYSINFPILSDAWEAKFRKVYGEIYMGLSWRYRLTDNWSIAVKFINGFDFTPSYELLSSPPLGASFVSGVYKPQYDPKRTSCGTFIISIRRTLSKRIIHPQIECPFRY